MESDFLLNGSVGVVSKCRVIVDLSQTMADEGSVTGSTMRVDMIGSVTVSG